MYVVARFIGPLQEQWPAACRAAGHFSWVRLCRALPLQQPRHFELIAGGVAVAGEQEAAVRREAQGLDRCVQLFQGQRVAGVHLPEADGAVLAAGGEPAAVRTESD